MKQLATIILLAATTSFATEPSVVIVKEPVVSNPFSKGEWGVESFYTARFSGSFDKPQQGIGFGGNYSLTENLVVAVRGISYNQDAQFVNEIVGRVAYRAPLGAFKNKVAPYAFTEGGGNLQSGEGFAGAGGGLEVRPWGKRVKLFVESDLRVNTEWKSSVGLNGGIGFQF